MPVDLVNSTTTWSLLLGIAMPWLVALVNQPWWPRWARQWVAIVCSIAGGVLVCLSTGAFTDVTDVLGACAIVLIASQAVYGRLFAKSQHVLEERTSGGRHRAPEDAETG